MAGIPPQLLNRLREILLRCEQFESDRNLRAIFTSEPLRPWRSSIPQADSLTSRVDNLIGFLVDKHRSDTKKNALVLFVSLLSGQINQEDERHQQLADLALELERAIVGSTKSTRRQKILVLAAIPYGLRLDKQIREIEEAIKRAVKRDLFEIKVKTAVRPIDIRRALAEERPQIVHFCGHGMPDGSLVLEDDGGNNKLVLPEGLAELFKLHADYVNCVLLNACYSTKSAQAIIQHIDYVIGMNQEINDKATIAFTQGFYDALGYESLDTQDVFQRAFDEGLLAIKLEETFSEAQIPVIEKK